MKAISLWQPWASMCVTPIRAGHLPIKRYETRSWAPPASVVGQHIVIHAAKRWNRDLKAARDRFWRIAPVLMGLGPFEPPLGALVGTVRLVRVHPTEDVRPYVRQPEEFFGDFSDGRFAWCLEDPEPFEHPIPWRGSQGFFEVPDEVVESARLAA